MNISLHLFSPDCLCSAHSESQLHILGRDLQKNALHFRGKYTQFTVKVKVHYVSDIYKVLFAFKDFDVLRN